MIPLTIHGSRNHSIGAVQREVSDAIEDVLARYGLDPNMEEFEPTISNVVYDLVSRFWQYDKKGEEMEVGDES